jgi:hypothetical protein
MADWDKAAEQIDEMAEHFRQVFIRLDRIEAAQQRCIAIVDRIIDQLSPDAQQRRQGMDLVKRQMAENDRQLLALEQRNDGRRITALQNQLDDIGRRLTALEERWPR